MMEIMTLFIVVFAAMTFVVALITVIVKIIDVLNKKKQPRPYPNVPRLFIS